MLESAGGSLHPPSTYSSVSTRTPSPSPSSTGSILVQPPLDETELETLPLNRSKGSEALDNERPKRRIWHWSTPSAPRLKAVLVVFLRSIRMVFLTAIGPWKCTQEQPKVAIHQHWLPTIFALSVHAIPFAAATTLLSINLNTTYPKNYVSATSLQYLAKALELLTQASICATTLAYLRTEYISNDGIPFGAITAGLQLNKLSYLWSLDFLGSLWSPTFPRRRKMIFAVFILFATLLNATVGPSIATSLIPRPVRQSGEFHLNETERTLYPQRLEMTSVPNSCILLNQNKSIDPSIGQLCPSTGWESLGQLGGQPDGEGGMIFAASSIKGYNKYEISNKHTLSTKLESDLLKGISNKMRHSTDFPHNHYYRPRSLLLSSPMSHLLEVLAYLRYFSLARNQVFTETPFKVMIQAPSPIAIAFCQKPDNSTRKDGSLPADSTTFQFVNPLTNTKSIVEFPNTRSYAADVRSWEISWSHASASGISIIALLSNQTEPWYRRHLVCPIVAGWANSTISITRNQNPEISNIKWSRDPVEISEKWAYLLAPNFSESGSSVINQLEKLPYFHPYKEFYNVDDLGYWDGFTESHSLVLAALVVNGMSSFISRRTFSYADFSRPSEDFPAFSGPYEVHLDGFAAYSSQGLPVKLSLAVLAAYVTYTLTFILISIGFDRTTSFAWNSMSELTALALLSKPPEKSLKNTRAGIETVELFKQQVHIRVVENDNLELVFKEEDPNRKTESIVKNKAY